MRILPLSVTSAPHRRGAATVRLAVLAGCAGLACGGNAAVFVNEIHYDNTGADSGEFVELAGPTGTDLTGWALALYNGSPAALAAYSTVTLDGRVLGDDTGTGYGFSVVAFPANGIQNGAPDGLALIDPDGNVQQFLSYEGSFTAVAGPAAGLTAVDIGVVEDAATALGFSLQLAGDGMDSADFAWAGPAPGTPGCSNTGQTFAGGAGSCTAQPPSDPVEVSIPEIQGAAHQSPFAGMTVTTEGVVTAVTGSGFYLQDLVGDDDPATSDGLFAFTGEQPALEPGDLVRVTGSIVEFTPGGTATGNLSITEFSRPAVEVLAAGGALPAPSVIGASGRVPPAANIDDDLLASYDPQTDGIDFYESLEGMRVLVEDAVAVSATSRFGEIYTLANNGADATGRNPRGGITIDQDDFNPERVQVQLDPVLLPGFEPRVDTGDHLGDIVGVVSYAFGNTEILASEAFDVTPAALPGERTALAPGRGQLAIASFNLLNLDPNDADGDADVADGRFDALAAQIVHRLRAPDIVGVQEIQDNSGSLDDGVVDADLTLATLTAAIREAGGPGYAFVDNPPQDNRDGGQPGGNIRVAFLYNPRRVKLVEGSAQALIDTDLADGDAFAASRRPLAASFRFRGNTLHLVNNHFASKGGSTPLFGAVQPPVNGGEDQRRAQAALVNAYVDTLLSADPDANVVVLGDLNEFQFLPPLRILEGDDTPALVNLTESLPLAGRYSFVVDGNAQALDHILVSHNLAGRAAYDIVHLNSEFADPASDHDPAVVRLGFEPKHRALRIATFNASLNRGEQGQLIAALRSQDDAQARAVAEIIQRVRPDVLLLNEFDFDAEGRAAALFQRNYLRVSQQGAAPIFYRHQFLAPSNTGVDSGFDLNNNGILGEPDDASGFGAFPGQFGMLVLSRYPIDHQRVRTFRNFLWKDMPGAKLPDDPATPEPADWYSAEELAVLPLSSKSHWDLPVRIDGRTLHLLASHPTPPVFDGPEDRNGRRNHDEIRFWADYVTPERGAYVYDDRARRGGLPARASFVLVGDLNADPQDGDSTDDPIALLLGSPEINAKATPASLGAADASLRQGRNNLTHRGAAAFDTADFGEDLFGGPGNLRVDYVLPSGDIATLDAGVFWPAATDPLFSLVGDFPFPSSDHRLVWLDVEWPRQGDRRPQAAARRPRTD